MDAQTEKKACPEVELLQKSHYRALREVTYKEKFQNAFRGLYVMAKATRHIFIHLLAALGAIVLGFYFQVSSFEWTLLVFAIGFVFVTEAVNTAIEIDIDLTSPEYHPYARDTKDVAAAAVLLSAFTAVIIGLIIFLPKIMGMLQ